MVSAAPSKAVASILAGVPDVPLRPAVQLQQAILGQRTELPHCREGSAKSSTRLSLAKSYVDFGRRTPAESLWGAGLLSAKRPLDRTATTTRRKRAAIRRALRYTRAPSRLP